MRLLFLCNHNNARGQMAEGLLRQLNPPDVTVFNTSIEPYGMQSEAVQVMKELGIDISHQNTQPLDRYLSEPMDLVITICDAPNETSPIYPRTRQRWFWTIPDPARDSQLPSERLEAFRRARDELRLRIENDLMPLLLGKIF